MEIIIKNSPAEVATAAADVMAQHIKPNAKIGLATGSTPLAMYQELIRRYEQGGISFAGCTAFLLDEYIGLPKTHEQSYYRFIRDNFTNHIDIEDALVFSPDGEAKNPREAGEEYDEQIAEAGGIDIQLLGIGANGHVGFNEPGSSLSSNTRVKVLHPQTVKDNARFFGGEEADVPIKVLTQGLGTISRAGHLLLIATGSGKAEAVRNLVEGPVSSNCPASILQLHRVATVIVDNEAAALLQHADYYRFAYENR